MKNETVRVGDKIEIISMDASISYVRGTRGTVEWFDSKGYIYGSWGTIPLIPSKDTYKRLKPIYISAVNQNGCEWEENWDDVSDMTNWCKNYPHLLDSEILCYTSDGLVQDTDIIPENTDGYRDVKSLFKLFGIGA